MSISASLSSALSGLTATSRAAALVSSNVSNALTEGYGRRELALSARPELGVRIDGVVRQVDASLIGERQLADASAGYARATSDFYGSLERLLGAPDDPASLPGRLARLDASLIEAAARPDSQARLQGLLNALTSVAETFRSVSGGLQELRRSADRAIAADVERLNEGLSLVSELNAEILRTRAAGRDASALLDQQQSTIDKVSEIVPLRVIPRENGTVGLTTSKGAVLLDIKPAVIAFEARGVITPDMTLTSGSLSGLTVNGIPVGVSGRNAPFAGGTIAANFDVRDTLAVGVQIELDAAARDLIERLEDPIVDTTRAPGTPGILTDRGAPFDPLNEVGLAGRLEVSSLVDPTNGGALWRLRDGLGATAEGPVGDNALLVRLGEALGALREPASGSVASGARSAPALAGDLLSLVSVGRQEADQRLSFASTRQEGLRLAELETGVDTDQELQKLLLIERAYAANARVVATVSELIDTLIAL